MPGDLLPHQGVPCVQEPFPQAAFTLDEVADTVFEIVLVPIQLRRGLQVALAHLPPGRRTEAINAGIKACAVVALLQLVRVYGQAIAQIADAIWEHLQPQGVAVILQCQHFCMCYRGVKKPGALTITSAVRGILKTNPSTRAEAMALLNAR